MRAVDRDRLSKLTVVIPTYNRQKFLLRNIDYWNGSNCQVIIIDGSQRSLSKDARSALCSNIRYFHWESSLSERLGKVVKFINTEYVILHGDDEFLLKQGISECILELDEDTSYSCVTGQCLGFRPRYNMIEGVSTYSRLRGYDVSGDSPKDRVLEHMKNYVPSQIYGVTRRRDWKLAVECLAKHEFSVYAVGELQFELCLSYAGKSKAIPCLTWLRSIGETPPIRNIASDPSLNEENRFVDWWADPEFMLERAQFINYTAESLEEIAPMAQKLLRQIVTEGCDVYVEYSKRSKRAGGARLRALLPAILRQLIGGMRFCIESLLGRRFSLVESGLNLQKSGISVDIEALHEIELDVASFHNLLIVGSHEHV